MSSAPFDPLKSLLDRARQGDDQGRHDLFEACRNYLHLLARAQVETWLRAKVDASDLVQQTMLEAYRDFDRFQGRSEGEWLIWLRQILRRNAADFVRHYRGTAKRQARRESPLAVQKDDSRWQGAAEPAARGDTPSQALIRRDNQLLVVEALSQLSEEHREVIVLRNLQRLPFDEVAQRMNRTRPAAQMLWTRAVKKLREQLESRME